MLPHTESHLLLLGIVLMLSFLIFSLDDTFWVFSHVPIIIRTAGTSQFCGLGPNCGAQKNLSLNRRIAQVKTCEWSVFRLWNNGNLQIMCSKSQSEKNVSSNTSSLCHSITLLRDRLDVQEIHFPIITNWDAPPNILRKSKREHSLSKNKKSKSVVPHSLHCGHVKMHLVWNVMCVDRSLRLKTNAKYMTLLMTKRLKIQHSAMTRDKLNSWMQNWSAIHCRTSFQHHSHQHSAEAQTSDPVFITFCAERKVCVFGRIVKIKGVPK